MFKVLKGKLIIVFVTVTVAGCGLIKNLPIFNDVPIVVSNSQASSIKENYIKNITGDLKIAYDSDIDKDLNSLSEVENSSDNYDNYNDNINKQEVTSFNLEKSNNNNEQKVISSDLEKSNNSNNVNSQSVANSQSEGENSNVSTEIKDITNDTLEVVIPTIHYDRTTSIYANDNTTLLRVEYYTNNKLIYYSVIEQFDATTKSYIEKIYQCNRETNIDTLVRTDEYINGNLIKSY